MATKVMGSVQVCEVAFSRRDIETILAEYIRKTRHPSYDFDDERPIIVWSEDGKSVKLRYLQGAVVNEYEPRGFDLVQIQLAKKGSA